MWSLIKKILNHEVALPIGSYSHTMKLVVGALLGTMAFILQSAGIFAGIGYLFSMMSTLPIVLACLLSLRIGVMTYMITAILLAMLQPSEVLIFFFTTGILGLGLGIGFKHLKRSLCIVPFTALCLTVGISILLYVIKFAILGPTITTHFNSLVILGIYIFSLIYSWMWLKVSVSMFNVLLKILAKV